jgi:hypothetical protein
LAGPVSIRPATLADVAFMDGLQKLHSKQVGYFPTKQFEGYVTMGGVLIAEDASGTSLGYCISRDRYLKRDELGVIYQLCIVPGEQRKLVGATLLKAVFERSAYGCKLYCCWCAQDIAANYFWESMGFVPVAFRAGSDRKRRVHIFWQRRINADDATTPYWYPSQTNAGAIREDRLVFPIPPGTHWSEVQAVALPAKEKPALPPVEKPVRKPRIELPPTAPGTLETRGLRFAPPAPPPDAAKPKRERAAKPKEKIDPKLITAARELRDRWLEHVNAMPLIGQGKYDVSRAIGQREPVAVETTRLLTAA